jgi:hypothetical protein
LNRRCAGNRACPSAGVQADQNETGDVTQRPFFSRNLLALHFAAMNSLHFTSLPARPDDGGSLRARQPSVAGLPLGRKCHADQAAVQPFPGMVVYGCAEVLKITTRPASIPSMFLVGPTSLAIDLGKALGSPPIVQASDPLIETLLVPLMFPLVVNKDRQHIRDRDGLNILLFSVRRMFFRQILIQDSFSFSNFLRSASRGDVSLAVPDDPVGSFRNLSFFISALGSEVESRSFTATRHSSLIKLILAKVV